MLLIKSIQPENSDRVIRNGGFATLIVGKGSYYGDIYLHSSIQAGFEDTAHMIYIGRYSSVANEVTFISDQDHAKGSVYQGCIPLYEDYGKSHYSLYGQLEPDVRSGMIVIGSDVWIGAGATLLSGICIGDGAVIGAESVVTKDVPSYAIVAGNPGKIIGYRFDEITRKKLNAISWWLYSDEKLLEIRDFMEGRIEEFVKSQFKGEFPERVESAKMVFLTFLDINDEYGVYADVIEEIITCRIEDSLFIIAYNKDDPVEVKAKDIIENEINANDTGESINKDIKIVGFSEADEEDLIRRTDYLILGRDINNITRIANANKYGVKTISGADRPILRDGALKRRFVAENYRG